MPQSQATAALTRREPRTLRTRDPYELRSADGGLLERKSVPALLLEVVADDEDALQGVPFVEREIEEGNPNT